MAALCELHRFGVTCDACSIKDDCEEREDVTPSKPEDFDIQS